MSDVETVEVDKKRARSSLDSDDAAVKEEPLQARLRTKKNRQSNIYSSSEEDVSDDEKSKKSKLKKKLMSQKAVRAGSDDFVEEDIHDDSRTGTVMAGGLSGTERSEPSAVTKKRLAEIRNQCQEAYQKSNEELILLLENYNDQVDMVIKALKTGKAEGLVRGSATTASKKVKTGKEKPSESDTGKDNASDASSIKYPLHPQASSDRTTQKKPLGNGTSFAPPTQRSAETQPNQQSKPSTKNPSNAAVVENGGSSQTQPQPPKVEVSQPTPFPTVYGRDLELEQDGRSVMDVLKGLMTSPPDSLPFRFRPTEVPVKDWHGERNWKDARSDMVDKMARAYCYHAKPLDLEDKSTFDHFFLLAARFIKLAKEAEAGICTSAESMEDYRRLMVEDSTRARQLSESCTSGRLVPLPNTVHLGQAWDCPSVFRLPCAGCLAKSLVDKGSQTAEEQTNADP